LEQGSVALPFAVEALLFDLDDTLYDRDQAYLDWACAFVQRYFPATHNIQTRGIINLLVSLDNHEDTPRDVLFSQFRDHYPTLHVPVATLIEEYYQEFLRFIRPLPEVRELLQALKEESIPFGIITNGSSRQLALAHFR
jgi:FMN phosphatase YigB (HAD superfamily)